MALISRRLVPERLRRHLPLHTSRLFALGSAIAGCLLASATSRRAVFAMPLPRRSAAAVGAAIVSLGSSVAIAEESTGPIKLTRVIAEGGLEDWSVSEYEAMRDDEPRTKGYENALQKRLKGKDGAVVVDIGTGAFALLAILAAKAGAKKVYAIEKNPSAVPLAKETIAKAGLQNTIEVIEGDSMQVKLPEKVDLIVSELIGSISTQEGVEPIIKDAQRFLKDDLKGNSNAMIPSRVQTQIAPVKYTEHRIMKFAEKRGILSRGIAAEGTLRPLRLRGKTRDLVFLAEPQLLEDFDFNSPESTPSKLQNNLKFDIPEKMADQAKDFSGFAMWTKLIIDDTNAVEVKGQKSTSHWAYVVALMDKLPHDLRAPTSIELKAQIDYGVSPVKYTLETQVPV